MDMYGPEGLVHKCVFCQYLNADCYQNQASEQFCLESFYLSETKTAEDSGEGEEKVVKAMMLAGNQILSFRKAILTPTARASILVAIPKVSSVLLEKVSGLFSSS